MSNWKLINLRDAVGKFVFDDEWGFVYIERISYKINNKNIDNYYVEGARKGYKKSIVINERKNVDELMALFSTPVYYGNSKTSITVESIDVCVSVSNDRYYYSHYSYAVSFNITEKTKKNLQVLRKVWYCSELQSKSDFEKSLKYPVFKDLKKGDGILYDGCKHIIQKIYKQPNKDGLMMSIAPCVKNSTDKDVDVSFKTEVYLLPYDEKDCSQTDFFNNSNNEFDLMPFAEYSGERVYVYWNKIDDASEYIVSLYRILLRPYLPTVYHMCDYIADRNDGFITIDGLDDRDYIITVRAENRNGEEIALSRGIYLDSGRCDPHFWENMKPSFSNVGVYVQTSQNKSASAQSKVYPRFKDLKKGDTVYYRDSRYTVQAVHKQPNKDGLMMSVLPAGKSKGTVQLSFSDSVYVKATDVQSLSEIQPFNDCKNEIDLMPFAVNTKKYIYVYWNRIEDVAGYIISLYKKSDRNYLQNIYHLKDYAVNRNKGFISIEGLEEKGYYIVTVKAENRNGEVIALSRGIAVTDSSPRFPQYWEDI